MTAAEDICVLNFVKDIYNKKTFNKGKNKTHTDDKKFIKVALNESDKEIKITQEASATFKAIKREPDKTTTYIEIEHSNDKPLKG